MNMETILAGLVLLFIEIVVLGTISWFIKDKITFITTKLASLETLAGNMNNSLVRLATTDEEQSKTIESLSVEFNSMKKWIHKIDTDVKIIKKELED